jgi:hypothetical protein
MNRTVLALMAGLVVLGVRARAQDASAAAAPAPHSGTETVLITYRVKAGDQAALLTVLRRQWTELRKANLVKAEPHLLLSGNDENERPYFVEVFSWVSHDAPEHVPPAVQDVWSRMAPLVEERDGHRGVEFPEVQIVPADAP